MSAAQLNVRPTVFISYSHKDQEWKDRIIRHLKVFESEAKLRAWSDEDIESGSDWLRKIEQAIDAASVAILLVSPEFLTSKFIREKEIPRIFERRKKDGLRVLPVVIEEAAWEQTVLGSIQAYLVDGKPLASLIEERRETEIKKLAVMVHDILKKAAPPHPLGPVPLDPELQDLVRLPKTGPRLFGRENELQRLYRAWESPDTRIVSLVAFGGVGKTALVADWLTRMSKEGFRGATRVYAWSFYHRGDEEGGQTSANTFLEEALGWFGDAHPSQGSELEKGARLADLVGRRRNLLVLDGLEPLQIPPGKVAGEQGGELKDKGMRSLLVSLAYRNHGLCVITTRFKIADLLSWEDSTVSPIRLEALSEETGARYLDWLGVKGSERELLELSKEYGGHALALTLIGGYLKRFHRGDVKEKDRIPPLTDDSTQGAHARRVMQAYADQFGDRLEGDILRMMGLFDRRIGEDVYRVLAEGPVMPGLPSGMTNFPTHTWRQAVQNLADSRLVSEEVEEDEDEVPHLDCHPLTRGYFRSRLKKDSPNSWKEAHQRLFQHYAETEPELPSSVPGLEPLFAAVAHGCAAGSFQSAFDQVYWPRILRGEEYYCTRHLGAIGSELAVVSNFFEQQPEDLWTRPSQRLPVNTRGRLLRSAGFLLRSQGRIKDAMLAMEAGLNTGEEHKAEAAGYLSEMASLRGIIGKAMDYANRALELLDAGWDTGKKGPEYWRAVSLADLGRALHMAGKIEEAEQRFEQAEAARRRYAGEGENRGKVCTELNSIPGFYHCDLLLDQAERERDIDLCKEVRAKARETLRCPPERDLVDAALDQLTIGRSLLQEEVISGVHGGDESGDQLKKALDGLAAAGMQEFYLLGLLLRARWCRLAGHYEAAHALLNEALWISRHGAMKLARVDCCLEHARLHLARGRSAEARDSLQEARSSMPRENYRRRDQELEVIQAEVSAVGLG